MARTYKIATRTSPLALKQVEEILDIYPTFEAEIVGIQTRGDQDRAIPISEVEGSDFFTREIDEALVSGEADLAVHSAKDLPDKLPTGLCVAALTDSADPRDVLVSREGLRLDELPHEALIGTSSHRRKTQLKKYRYDFQIVDIRGNIEERLALLDNHSSFTVHHSRPLDAIVIAAAGLIRLGLEHRITQRIPLDLITPHPMQGQLAIVAREDDEEAKSLFGGRGSR